MNEDIWQVGNRLLMTCDDGTKGYYTVLNDRLAELHAIEGESLAMVSDFCIEGLQACRPDELSHWQKIDAFPWEAQCQNVRHSVNCGCGDQEENCP